eukprot:m.230956 g.230956  ORF g.230956 m.230956 type:complete len:742 (-) comp18202_c0_seq1:20-2245(-)
MAIACLLASLLLLAGSAWAGADVDWLVENTGKAEVDFDGQTITLTNGLVQRVFTLKPAFGVVDLILNASDALGGEQSMLRAIKPDTVVVLDGRTYAVGGLGQQSTFLAYLNRSDLQLTSDPNAFQYVNHTVSAPTAPFPWTPGARGSPKELAWPPKGVHLSVLFAAPSSAPPAHQNVSVVVHYELFDGIPLIAKWVSVSARGTGSAVVTAVTVEQIAVLPPYGPYLTHGSLAPGTAYNGAAGQSSNTPPPLLFAKSDQAHGAGCRWVDDYPNSHDPAGLQDQGAVEPMLNCTYDSGPGVRVNVQSDFVSFRVLLLACDSTDLERQSLSRHRVTQLLAPHTTENPIFFHATDVTEIGFKRAIDQMADVGFEMLIYSFGSGFVLETADPIYLTKIRNQVQYARSKGIEVGGYDLICLDRGHGGYGGNVGDEWDVVDDQGKLGEDACFASGWYDKLFTLVNNFINFTGLSMLETDGPYGGTPCASTNHTHHLNLGDSVYWQTRKQSDFFGAMRRAGLYINQPDDYFFQGGSRTGMGYDESQYSLPRWHDLTISRMGMYDDLYAHLPTQGWMFLPIVDYHGGGADAAFSPLSLHLEEYEWGLAQYLGAGVAACYRGNILYDTNSTRNVVKKWVSFYRAHRGTLIQPVVHLRRATMQGWDGWLHVNPFGFGSAGREVGAAMLFNPTDVQIRGTVSLPLYYTGLTDSALVSVNEGPASSIALDRSHHITLALTMPPRSIHTVVISRP